jgi:NAD-dependent SIR2 family protein deacetylase
MNNFQNAAVAINNANAILITAGAGLGVDSGLPDFRGNDGFWRAYPVFSRLGLGFQQLANPRWFADDPELAWGFYGHRLNLYRDTTPHDGFRILRDWSQQKTHGAFIFTSNVDGQFQRAGFGSEQMDEAHGSIHHLQCSRPCNDAIWDASSTRIEVDEATMRARQPLPLCPRCNAVARPNILMFGDWGWSSKRSDAQGKSLQQWLQALDKKTLVVIELGAGKHIPTVRMFSESLQGAGATLVRINPRDSDGPRGTISIATGALDGLQQIENAM